MSSEPTQPPDERGLIIYVGQDLRGRWIVQDGDGNMEGRFVSRSAALSFAQAEREIYHARLEMAAFPLVPLVSIGPVTSDAHVLPRAA